MVNGTDCSFVLDVLVFTLIKTKVKGSFELIFMNIDFTYIGDSLFEVFYGQFCYLKWLFLQMQRRVYLHRTGFKCILPYELQNTQVDQVST